MNDLIVVCFKDEFTADEVLLDLGKLGLEYYLEQMKLNFRMR